jgi:hypothetical protein
MSLRFTPSQSPYRGAQAGDALPPPLSPSQKDSGARVSPFLFTVDGSPIAPAKSHRNKGSPWA